MEYNVTSPGLTKAMDVLYHAIHSCLEDPQHNVAVIKAGVLFWALDPQ